MSKSERIKELDKLREIAEMTGDRLIPFKPNLYLLERGEEVKLLDMIPKKMSPTGFIENVIRMVLQGKITIKEFDNTSYFKKLLKEEGKK